MPKDQHSRNLKPYEITCFCVHITSTAISTSTVMFGWFELSLLFLSCLAVLVQCFTIWLVLNKSPVPMRSYRFFLVANSASDLCFAVVLGFLIQPDLLFPAPAIVVQGLARFFGPYGGVIAFALAVFAGTCQVHFQNWSLLYRWSVVQDRFPMLGTSLTSPKMLVFIAVHGQLIAAAIGVGTWPIFVEPELVPMKLHLLYNNNLSEYNGGQGHVLLLANLANGLADMPTVAPVIAIGLLICACVWTYLSVAIMRLFRAQAHVFSSRTYQLHMQLNILLIVQLVSPVAFIIFPVALGLLGIVAHAQFEKSAGQLGVLLFALYALNSPLMTILFVSPYRRFTFRLIGLERLMLRCHGKMVDSAQPSQQQQQPRQRHGSHQPNGHQLNVGIRSSFGGGGGLHPLMRRTTISVLQ